MKTILTGLAMDGYWPGSVFMYVRGIEVCVCARMVCACGVCVRVVCVRVCVCSAYVWCIHLPYSTHVLRLSPYNSKFKTRKLH